MLKYSIIVPVYNVEKYLKECLDSILAQDTKSAYEVILVDDGSTDGSDAICNDYADHHEDIYVIHKENGGVSSARNAGIEAARGKYILFMDSDDLYEQNTLSTLDDLLNAVPEPDMVTLCGRDFSEQDIPLTGQLYRPAVIPQGESGLEYMQRCFSLNQIPTVAVWLYLYRRQFLLDHDLRFSESLAVAEDVEFNVNCLSQAKTVFGTDKILYQYRITAGSVSHRISVKNTLTRLQVLTKWYRRYPVAPVADYFAKGCLSISMVGSKKAASELIALAEENRDIFQNVGDRKMKLARFLYRTFGFYTGSAIYLDLVKLKHLLQGKGKAKL